LFPFKASVIAEFKLQNEAGILPVFALLAIASNNKLLILPIVDGKLPLRQLFCRDKYVSPVSAAISLGIAPEMLLLLRCKSTRLDIIDSVVGSPWESRFALINSPCNATKPPTSSGIGPVSWLLPRWKNFNARNEPIEVGMDPDSELPSRCKDVSKDSAPMDAGMTPTKEL